MALQLFNFSSYIEEQLRPLATNYFHVQSLAGGFTNETVRVSFDPPIQFDPASRETTTRLTLKSVVLKYAPPYLASDPTQPMSVCRQSIEAKALQVLTGDAYPEMVDVFNDTPNIRIPKLIYHDIQKNVLWIEDLGDTFTLSEYLLSDASADPSLCTRLGIHAQNIAEDLGRFLVKLYKATTNPPKELITYLDTTNNTSLSTKTYIANITVDILRGEGIADADVLAERVRRGLLEDDQGESCLGMVDFWTESVLIGKENDDDDTTNSRSCQCGLVDWEYFGVSSAASELGMFLAHLHIHMLNSTSSPAIKERITSFSTTMFNSYSHNAAGAWIPSANFKRQFLLSHGRELVNGIQIYNEKLDQDAKIKVLRAGIRSLRAAGGDDDELNLDLIKEDHDSDDCHDSRRIWQAFIALRFE